MAQKKKSSRFKEFEGLSNNERHIRITLSMMRSAAWLDLSMNARGLYLEMKTKYDSTNEEAFNYTYAEGVRLLSKETYPKCLSQLIDHGFIKLQQSGWTTRTKSVYAFSSMWKHYGTDKFKVTPLPTKKKKTPKTD